VTVILRSYGNKQNKNDRRYIILEHSLKFLGGFSVQEVKAIQQARKEMADALRSHEEKGNPV